MVTTLSEIRDSFAEEFPSSTILAMKFKDGGYCSYYGKRLLCLQLKDGDYIRVYHLAKSNASGISNDDAKLKAFPWIYDTRSETDPTKRKNILKDKLKACFPGYHVSVFIYNDCDWSTVSTGLKAECYFKKEYGHDVLITLN